MILSFGVQSPGSEILPKPDPHPWLGHITIYILWYSGSALDAAEKATLILEDAGETNAG